MILSTTPQIEGHPIREYKGVVTGEVIIGANVLKDFMAGLTDFFGGRSSSYEKVLIEAKDSSMQEMMQRAQALGANAIVGIDINTLYNPYYKVRDDGTLFIQPATAEAYCNRDWDFPYKIDRQDLCFRLFTEAGFEWGGDWISPESKQQIELSVAIANRIYEILEIKGMTQKDLAQRLGKTETEVSRWLSGTHNLTLSTICKIYTALGEDLVTVPKS